jgi:predicted nucleic acid-binding protein
MPSGARRKAVEHIDRALKSGSLATTAITAFELSSGARSLRAAEKVQALRTPIGMADYLIAGICLQRSATLLTRNRGHFARVPGLELGPVFPGD